MTAPRPAADQSAAPSRASASVAYPPEPWDLRGSGQLSLWRLPTSDLPDLPAGARALTLRGQAVACSAFVQYDETGLLPYSELLAGVVVRSPVGTGLSITHIWVDSPASQAGGRELWGIPKQLADFGEPDHAVRSAAVAGVEIASASFLAARPPALPLPIPLPARTIQTLAGATVASRLLMRGRLRWARASWELPADGELPGCGTPHRWPQRWHRSSRCASVPASAAEPGTAGGRVRERRPASSASLGVWGCRRCPLNRTNVK